MCKCKRSSKPNTKSRNKIKLVHKKRLDYINNRQKTNKAKMWHEARRQERKIRGMLVDYRKRAERRRDFYEKIKADPTQFLQVHGRQCRIHLDPAIAAAADSAVMMPWQGNTNNLIDRFDVRAHLDHIPPVKKEEEDELTQDERHLNYERYRIIAQNGYLSISEEKFLKQLHLEEQFGYTEIKSKKETKGTGAAIGFNYEEGTAITAPAPTESPEENFEDDNSDSDLDVDLAINVSKIDSTQAHEMNKHGQQFGMSGNDFYSFLTDDMEEAESYKLAKEEEHEKALFSGRKSRRERRAHREKRLANRKISPPSYAAKESPTNPSLRDDSKSPSRSPSPDAGKITYITSFGDDEETPSSSKATYADKVKYGKAKKRESSDRLVYFGKKSRSSSREVSYGRRRRSSSRSKRSRSRSKSRRSRSRNRRSRSRSRSKKSGYSYSKERSRSRSPRPKPRTSETRSRSTSVKGRKSYSTSRSRSTSQRSRSRTVRSRSRSSRSRSHTERSKSRSRSRSISRNRRSRSRSRQRLKTYHRRSVSSSSLSSSTSSSKSRSRSRSPSLNRTKSKSRSRSVEAPSPPRIVPRYYGRKRSDESSSESSNSDTDSNQDVEMKPAFPVSGDSKYRSGNNSGTVSKRPAAALTVIERLKLKRQALINKQFKKDKIAEVQKLEREKQEQQTREDELREMAIKLRRRQREKRHAYDRSSSSDSEKSTSSRKKERSRSPRSKDRDSNKSDRERRDRERKSRSKDRERRDDRRGRSRERDRSSSRSRRRHERGREERDSKRGRSPDNKEIFRKLVDY